MKYATLTSSLVLLMSITACDQNNFSGKTSVAAEPIPVPTEAMDDNAAPEPGPEAPPPSATKPLTQAGGIPGGHFDLH